MRVRNRTKNRSTCLIIEIGLKKILTPTRTTPPGWRNHPILAYKKNKGVVPQQNFNQNRPQQNFAPQQGNAKRQFEPQQTSISKLESMMEKDFANKNKINDETNEKFNMLFSKRVQMLIYVLGEGFGFLTRKHLCAHTTFSFLNPERRRSKLRSLHREGRAHSPDTSNQAPQQDYGMFSIMDTFEVEGIAVLDPTAGYLSLASGFYRQSSSLSYYFQKWLPLPISFFSSYCDFYH